MVLVRVATGCCTVGRAYHRPTHRAGRTDHLVLAGRGHVAGPAFVPCSSSLPALVSQFLVEHRDERPDHEEDNKAGEGLLEW